MHDRFIRHLQSMQYREKVYHLKLKNLQYINELTKMIDRKL